MIKKKDPECYDEVKNVKNDTVGTVIAKCKIGDLTYLDVRVGDERVYYQTPMSNWVVVKAYDPLLGWE